MDSPIEPTRKAGDAITLRYSCAICGIACEIKETWPPAAVEYRTCERELCHVEAERRSLREYRERFDRQQAADRKLSLIGLALVAGVALLLVFLSSRETNPYECPDPQFDVPGYTNC